MLLALCDHEFERLGKCQRKRKTKLKQCSIDLTGVKYSAYRPAANNTAFAVFSHTHSALEEGYLVVLCPVIATIFEWDAPLTARGVWAAAIAYDSIQQYSCIPQQKEAGTATGLPLLRAILYKKFRAYRGRRKAGIPRLRCCCCCV